MASDGLYRSPEAGGAAGGGRAEAYNYGNGGDDRAGGAGRHSPRHDRQRRNRDSRSPSRSEAWVLRSRPPLRRRRRDDGRDEQRGRSRTRRPRRSPTSSGSRGTPRGAAGAGVRCTPSPPDRGEGPPGDWTDHRAKTAALRARLANRQRERSPPAPSGSNGRGSEDTVEFSPLPRSEAVDSNRRQAAADLFRDTVGIGDASNEPRLLSSEVPMGIAIDSVHAARLAAAESESAARSLEKGEAGSSRDRAPPPPLGKEFHQDFREMSHEEYREYFIRSTLAEYSLATKREATAEEAAELRRQVLKRYPGALPGEPSGESSADEYTGSDSGGTNSGRVSERDDGPRASVDPLSRSGWISGAHLAESPACRETLQPGAFVRFVVEPQATTGSLRCRAELLGVVRQVSDDRTGPYLDIFFVGCDDKNFHGHCVRSLLKRHVPESERAYIHLCSAEGCAGRHERSADEFKKLDKKRIRPGIHCRYFQVTDVRSCTEGWAAPGLKAYAEWSQKKGHPPRPGDKPSRPDKEGKPTPGGASSRDRALADRVGPAGDENRWEAGALGPLPLAPPAGAPGQRGRERAAGRSEPRRPKEYDRQRDDDLAASMRKVAEQRAEIERFQKERQELMARLDERDHSGPSEPGLRDAMMATLREIGLLTPAGEVAGRRPEGAPGGERRGREDRSEERPRGPGSPRRDRSRGRPRGAAALTSGAGGAGEGGGGGGSPPRHPSRDRRSSSRKDRKKKDRKKKREDRDRRRGRSRSERDDDPRPSAGRVDRPRRTGQDAGRTHVPGLHSAHFEEDLMGRAPGTFGIGLPEFKSSEVVAAMVEAFERANAARTQRLEREKGQRRRERRRRRKEARRKRSPSSSSSTGSSSSSSGAANLAKLLGKDDQPFREAARSHPGVIFANAVAQARQAIAQVNHELQPSRTGPVIRSWMDIAFKPKHGSKIGAHGDELEMLTIVLDEIIAGRYVEAADVLASRLRMLSVGIGEGKWRTAEELLVYRPPTQSLLAPTMMDVATAAAEKRQKREERALKVNRVSSR